MLTHKRLLELLEYDSNTGIFRWKFSRKKCKAGSIAGSFYTGAWYIKIDKKSYRASRLAWYYVYGIWPEKEVDHINRDTKNNRIQNLRLATRKQNQQNRGKQKNNKAGFKGVFLNKQKNKFTAFVEKKYLGLYNTAEEASAAYEKAAEEAYGAFYYKGE
jgi:hypothetical protein